MAAKTTCMGRFPLASSCSQNGTSTGLKRFADTAGKYRALRRGTLPALAMGVLPAHWPERRIRGLSPA